MTQHPKRFTEGIDYRKLPKGGKYKYELLKDYRYRTGWGLDTTYDVWGKDEHGPLWIRLSSTGELWVSARYNWDGATCWFDSPEIMRGSLVHDSQYQLCRDAGLPYRWRKPIDALLHQICLEDGMGKFQAAFVYAGVRLAGWPFARPKK